MGKGENAMKQIKKKTKSELKKLEKEIIPMVKNYEIDTLKRELEKYIDVLVKYDFVNTASASCYFLEVYNNALRQGFDVIDKAKVPEKERDVLRHDVCGLFVKDDNKTKEEREIDYYKVLIARAKHEIEDFNHDLKLKVVRESLDHFYLWTDQFNRNCKVYNRLKELKKKK